MGFDLTVSTPRRPNDLKPCWEQEFAKHGFDVEIYPSFDPETHRGGYLPFRVVTAPRELIGTDLESPALSGFEVSFSAESAHLWTGAGRTTTEFALQCIGAATLARVCEGQYFDDYSGAAYDADEGIVAAVKEIKVFLKKAGDRELKQYPFPGWDKLG